MSFPLAFTHRGTTSGELLITGGPRDMVGGGLVYELSIPEGTPCWRLADGRWIVRDLGLAGNVLLCSLSEHPGVVIDETNVSEISRITLDHQQTKLS